MIRKVSVPSGSRNREEKRDVTLPAEICDLDPTTTERTDAKSAAKCAEHGRVDAPVDAFDLARAIALAVALEPFVRDDVRPLARELVDVLRAAQPGADVVSIRDRFRGPGK